MPASSAAENKVGSAMRSREANERPNRRWSEGGRGEEADAVESEIRSRGAATVFGEVAERSKTGSGAGGGGEGNIVAGVESIGRDVAAVSIALSNANHGADARETAGKR